MKTIDIKKLRKKLRLRAAEFAALIGVHWVTVSRWENGHNKPSEMAIRQIREIMKRRTI